MQQHQIITDIIKAKVINNSRLRLETRENQQLLHHLKYIPNLSVKQLIIWSRNKNNLSLQFLNNVSLHNLKRLVLYDNGIKDISILGTVQLNQLVDLDMSRNEIESIQSLNKNFNKLRVLHLNNNKIINLKELCNAKFIDLQQLNLSHNNLHEISIFIKFPFKNLTQLILNGNKITNVQPLKKMQFDRLKILNLNNNHIYDLEFVNHLHFPALIELMLMSNHISHTHHLLRYSTNFLLSLSQKSTIKTQIHNFIRNTNSKIRFNL